MAAKKPKAEKAPLTRCGGTMTEAAYLAWIRSALRSKSLRWLPRSKALEANRTSYSGPNKAQKWVYHCEICKGKFKGTEVCVDHYPKPAGSILSVHDIGQFAENLFCEVDNLRVLCVPCHAAHTLAEKSGISMEEAILEKRVTEVMKRNNLLDYLANYGYSGASVSNATKRRALVTKILKENK
jgi:hypothetical protein